MFCELDVCGKVKSINGLILITIIMEATDGIGDFTDPFRCRLNLVVPPGKRRLLRKILSPLMQWIDPSFQIINIIEKVSRNCSKSEIVQSSELEYIRTPALSVLLFLSENGIICAKEGQEFLRKKPWKYHHKIELISRRSPDRAAACQEFFGISSDMPLWSVCPIHCGNEHLRILIYVRNFKKMVDFYRVMMDVEMESNKPGFCIFQIYVQPGLDFQLALKYSKYIEPYPLDNSNLVFKVKNLETVKTYLECTISPTDNGLYSVRDPDGNMVYLYEESQKRTPEDIVQTDYLNRKTTQEDLKSYRSSSDSHDSGRCSDSENWFSESEQIRPETSLGFETKRSRSKLSKYQTLENVTTLDSIHHGTRNYESDTCSDAFDSDTRGSVSERTSNTMYI